MALRRMFNKEIVSSDRFIEMPSSSQLLFFHLGVNADDEGFVSSPKRILRSVGCHDDDLKILVAKGFVIDFESGIIVISNWKEHNNIRKDRFTPTRHIEEKAQLQLIDMQQCQPSDNQVTTKCPHRLGKVRLGKVSIDKEITPPKSPKGTSDVFSSVYNYYMTFQNLKRHRRYTPEMENAIKVFIKRTSSTIEDCKTVIQRHSSVVEQSASSNYPVKARPLTELFGQKVSGGNHLIASDYLSDGKYGDGYYTPNKNKVSNIQYGTRY